MSRQNSQTFVALPSGGVGSGWLAWLVGGCGGGGFEGVGGGVGDAYKWKTNNRFSVCTLHKNASGHAGVWLGSNQRS